MRGKGEIVLTGKLGDVMKESARTAISYIRANAEKFGIDKHKVAAMGSSAGGSLCSLLSTCLLPLEGEGTDGADREEFLPDFQILCYPVISLFDNLTHADSKTNLLGSGADREALAAALSPETHLTKQTPPAFIWHTADDPCVKVGNSLLYAEKLHAAGVPCECHIFPHGSHGLGLATELPDVRAWSALLLTALDRLGF